MVQTHYGLPPRFCLRAEATIFFTAWSIVFEDSGENEAAEWSCMLKVMHLPGAPTSNRWSIQQYKGWPLPQWQTTLKARPCSRVPHDLAEASVETVSQIIFFPLCSLGSLISSQKLYLRILPINFHKSSFQSFFPRDLTWHVHLWAWPQNTRHITVSQHYPWLSLQRSSHRFCEFGEVTSQRARWDATRKAIDGQSEWGNHCTGWLTGGKWLYWEIETQSFIDQLGLVPGEAKSLGVSLKSV